MEGLLLLILYATVNIITVTMYSQTCHKANLYVTNHCQ